MKVNYHSKNIRVFLLVYFIVFFAGNCFSQSQNVKDFLQLDTILFFENEKSCQQNQIGFSQWNRELLFTTYHTSLNTDTIKVYILDIDTKKTTVIPLYIKGICSSLQKNHSMDFADRIAYNHNYIALMHSSGVKKRKIHLFQRKDDDKFDYYKSITTNFPTHDIYFIDTTNLILGELYYRDGANFAKLNIINEKISKTIHPYHNNKYMTLFTSKQYDIKDGIFLLANRNEYSFLVFNNDLNQTDSTYFNVENWIPLSKSVLKKVTKIHKKYTYAASDIMYYLMKYYLKIHQLNRAYIIDNNKIMLAYTPAKKTTDKRDPRHIINIWQKDDSGWHKIHTDIHDQLGIHDSVITKHSFSLEFLSNYKTAVFSDKIVQFRENGTNFNPIGKTNYQYYEHIGNYLSNNEPIIELRIFDHSF